MVFYRISGNPLKGIGHLSRSISFIEYIQTQRKKFDFLIFTEENPVSRKFIRNLPAKFIKKEEEFLDEIKRKAPYLIIFDMPDILEEYKEFKFKSQCVYFTDTDKFSPVPFAKLVFNPDPFQKKFLKKYKEETPCTEYFFGLKYEVFSFIFSIRKTRFYGKKNVFVYLGNIEMEDKIKIIEFLFSFSFDRVFYLCSSHKEEHNFTYPHSWTVLKDLSSSSIREHFYKSTMAILSMGTIVMEAMASGLPCCVISYTDRLYKVAEYLREKEGIIHAGKVPFLDFKKIEKFLSLEISSLRKISSRAVSLVDGKGIERVYNILEKRKLI